MADKRITLDQFKEVTEKDDTWVVGYSDKDNIKECVRIKASSMGGSEEFTETDPTTVTIGGLPAGTVITGENDHEILQRILFPYQKPTCSLTINPATTVYKLGTSVSNITMNTVVGKKSKPITRVEFYTDAGLFFTKTDGVSGGGTFSTTYANEFTEDKGFQTRAYDETGAYTDSNIVNVYFVDPMFVGTVNGSLTELVQRKANYTYNNITCINDQVVFQYPAGYGLLTSIMDKNNFECITSFTESLITKQLERGGTRYRQYKLTTAATLNNFSFTFKF